VDQGASFPALCKLLLRHAAFTVGGGGVTTVALERDLLERKWLDRDTFRAFYGLARLTPGTVVLALVTAIGWHLFRWRGALFALVIASLPGSILAAVLTEVQSLSQQSAVGRAFFAGSAAAVCGLLAASIWKIVEPYLGPVHRASSVLIIVLAVIAAVLKLSPFFVIIAAGAAGFLLTPREASS
jgi:chromate transport protein ChrA